MTQPGSSGHDPAPTANHVQLHADPQEIYTIDSENDDPMTVDTEEIEVIDISIDEEDSMTQGPVIPAGQLSTNCDRVVRLIVTYRLISKDRKSHGRIH